MSYAGGRIPQALLDGLTADEIRQDYPTRGEVDADYPTNTEADARYSRLDGGNDYTAMPTVNGAPIVESGSNTDGGWTRWADGTQLCLKYGLSGGSTGPAAGQFDINWIFPVAFSSNSYAAFPLHVGQSGVPAGSRGGGFESTSGATRTMTSNTFRYFTPGSAAHSITQLDLSVTAIGRWK